MNQTQGAFHVMTQIDTMSFCLYCSFDIKKDRKTFVSICVIKWKTPTVDT